MMGNKKRDLELSIGEIIIIVLAFTALIVLIKNIFQEQDFVKNITKEKCVNETVKEYYNYPDDFKIIECLDEFIKTSCYDNNGNLIINLTCKKQNFYCYELENKSGILTEEIKDYGYEIFNWYEKNNFKPYTSPDTIEKGKTTKEVCNKIEVDAIEIIKEIYKYGKEGEEWCKNITSKPESNSYESCIRFLTDYDIKIVSKKDITKEFLENLENCECIERQEYFGVYYTDEFAGREYCTRNNWRKINDAIMIDKGYRWECVSENCQKYKCFNDYEVEIK